MNINEIIYEYPGFLSAKCFVFYAFLLLKIVVICSNIWFRVCLYYISFCWIVLRALLTPSAKAQFKQKGDDMYGNRYFDAYLWCCWCYLQCYAGIYADF